ncbi:MAG: cysteine desulfurase family protein [Patescibacteria group bacterium]
MFGKKETPESYLDHAAATPLAPDVLAVMAPYFSERFGNPSSVHKLGRQGRVALEAARRAVAEHLGAHEDEIVFTSGGTASDNLAIVGSVRTVVKPHVVTTAIEHQAVLQPLEYLEARGEVTVTRLSVDHDGLVAAEAVIAAVQKNTVLVSVMYANNEIGTIEPIVQIGKLLRRLNIERASSDLPLVRFHTDACQAVQYLPLDVEKLGVDLLTLNAGKIYGPKGVGALFVRRGVELAPLTIGGGQEQGLVAGTENVAGAVGLAAAMDFVHNGRGSEIERVTKLRDELMAGLEKLFPDAVLTGSRTERLPNHVSLALPNLDADPAVVYLSEQGIHCGTGSACESSKGRPSHVLLACGLAEKFLSGSLRFTLGRSTTAADITRVLTVLPEVVKLVPPIKVFSENR